MSVRSFHEELSLDGGKEDTFHFSFFFFYLWLQNSSKVPYRRASLFTKQGKNGDLSTASCSLQFKKVSNSPIPRANYLGRRSLNKVRLTRQLQTADSD